MFMHKTAYELLISDWSSDVCSSDLVPGISRFPRILADPRGYRPQAVPLVQKNCTEMLRLFARRLSELQKNHEREVLTVSMPNDRELKRWFCQEVLPLEAMLTRYIRRNCSDPDLTADLRQDVYAAAIEGARRGLPESAGGYVHTIARNLLINRAKRSKLVSFEIGRAHV